MKICFFTHASNWSQGKGKKSRETGKGTKSRFLLLLFLFCFLLFDSIIQTIAYQWIIKHEVRLAKLFNQHLYLKLYAASAFVFLLFTKYFRNFLIGFRMVALYKDSLLLNNPKEPLKNSSFIISGTYLDSFFYNLFGTKFKPKVNINLVYIWVEVYYFIL